MNYLIKASLVFVVLQISASCQNDEHEQKVQKSNYTRFVDREQQIHIVKYELFDDKKSYLVKTKKELDIIYNRLSNKKARSFNTNIGRNRVYLNYRFTFSDGIIVDGEAVLHMFNDRINVEFCFEVDDGWMGGGPSLVCRLDDILTQIELKKFREFFEHKKKNLENWKDAKLALEEKSAK